MILDEIGAKMASAVLAYTGIGKHACDDIGVG
jgi:hypothetical protein